MSSTNGETINGDRDAAGRFVPGATGNKTGNPTSRRQRKAGQLRAALDAAMTKDAIAEIADGWVKDSKTSHTARRDLVQFYSGRVMDTEAKDRIERLERKVLEALRPK